MSGPVEDAEARLARAHAAKDLSRWTDVEQFSAEALSVEPNHPEAHCLMALAALRTERHAEAEKRARAALECDPEYTWSHRILALALVEQGGKRRGREALGIVDEAVRQNPAGALEHCVRGIVLGRLDRLKEAEEALRQSLALDPNDDGTHYQLGNVLLKRKDWANAERAFRDSLKIAPNDPDTLNNLGVALNLQKKSVDAAVAFKAAVLADPTHRLAKENARDTISSYLVPGGIGLAILFWIGVKVVTAGARIGEGAGALLAIPLAVALIVVIYKVSSGRSKARERDLQKADPELLQLYETLKRDRELKR